MPKPANDGTITSDKSFTRWTSANFPRAAMWFRPRIDPDTAQCIQSWFADKDFTSDWASGNFAVWVKHLRSQRHQPTDILEIGSWEGRSAVFFLSYLPMSTITCIDTFAGSENLRRHPVHSRYIAEAEARFDRNTAPIKDRVRKIKSRSLPALANLNEAGEHFDLIYIDGSHATDDVMLDTILSWGLLRPGGLMIWDDYRLAGPRPAIDAFLSMHRDSLTRIHRGYQMIVRKTAWM